jgi:CSLREA domain-containing protein
MTTKKQYSTLPHLLIYAVLVTSLILPVPAHAAPGLAIEVTTTADNTIHDGLCSLREAITNANANNSTFSDCTQGFSEDGIHFSNSLGAATITLTSLLPVVTDHNGLSIDGGGDITISGNDLFQVFRVFGAGSLTLESLTVQNGNAINPTVGGGVFNAGILTVRNSTFQNNRASGGGGAIFTGLGTLTVENSSFMQNQAVGSGGAIYNEGGTTTIAGSNFSENMAAQGGAVANFRTSSNIGMLTVTNSTFLKNRSDAGGGIYNYKATLYLTSTDFIRNGKDGLFNESGYVEIDKSEFIAQDRNGIHNLSDGTMFNFAELNVQHTSFLKNNGSGIYNDDAKANIFYSTFAGNRSSGLYNVNQSVVTIAQSALESNVAKYGGGIYNEASILHVHNSTFSGNLAQVRGGGAYNAGEMYVINSTFSSNQAKYHGGIYNASIGMLTLYNTILANSLENGDDCRNDGIVAGNNNLIEALSGDACGFLNGVNGNITGSDPDLDVLTGSPAYFPLNSGSLAIDTGDDAQCAAVSNQSQNGAIRPQGKHCDIGSYEAP